MNSILLAGSITLGFAILFYLIIRKVNEYAEERGLSEK